MLEYHCLSFAQIWHPFILSWQMSHQSNDCPLSAWFLLMFLMVHCVVFTSHSYFLSLFLYSLFMSLFPAPHTQHFSGSLHSTLSHTDSLCQQSFFSPSSSSSISEAGGCGSGHTFLSPVSHTASKQSRTSSQKH